MAKIIILTISHGASHRRVAQALRGGLLTHDPSTDARVVDALALCAPWFRAYYNSYEIPLKIWPALWGWIEGIQHRSNSTGPAWLYCRGARPLLRYLETEKPDIVVATEVGICELAAMFKRKAGARYRLVGTPTGVDIERPWGNPEVDLFVVAPGDAAAQLAPAGVPPAKILPCGMPVDPGFAAQRDRNAVRAKLGLAPDLPMALVLFGGAGFGKPRALTHQIKAIGRPLQAIFIAGRNQRLENELHRLCATLPGARVLGWVDNMHEWMAAADLLISKPGATTVIEALNSGLPLLAIDPLPGNERRACDWIEKQEVGIWVRAHSDLAATVLRLFASPETLDSLRANAQSLAKPRAAFDAAEAILKLSRPSA